MAAEIRERFETMEECYEFMLAYAAKGLTSDQGSESGRQLREFLNRAVAALTGIAESCSIAFGDESPIFLAVLERDARDAFAAIELVLAQPAISSQLIDNLNASMHLRALLTDVFLIGEVLRTQPSAANPAPQGVQPTAQEKAAASVP
jgi:hypothetical protein